MIYPRFVDHAVFRVDDLGETERFYTILLGEPSHQTEDSIMYEVGDTRLFFTACDVANSRIYDKEQIGLNHLAFGVRTLEELQTIREQLDRAGVVHSGIKIDQYGKKEFIWLDDPDGMRVEFYFAGVRLTEFFLGLVSIYKRASRRVSTPQTQSVRATVKH